MADRRRRAGHRLDALDGWQRWACIATIVGFGLLPLLVAGRALAQGWQPTGDVAIIALRSLDTFTDQAPTVGQPTTGQEVSGIDSYHPGPIENWVAGPFMRVLGPSVGILVAVALINGGALAASLWLGYRRGGPALLALTAALLALLVHALGPGSLFDPYNSELPTYPMIATALAAWSIVARDLVPLPALVGFASLAAQPHVAGAVTVAPMVLLAGVSLVLQLRRSPELWRQERRALVGALAVGVACWLPGLVRELTGPSNVWALVRTAFADGPALGLAYAAERVATAVAPIPLFAHPTGAYGFLEDQGPVGVLVAAMILGGAGSVALLVRSRQQRPGPARLYTVAIAATVVSAVVWAGSPPVAAYRVDSIRWLWVTGLLVWLSLLWGLWHLLAPSIRGAVQARAVPVAAAVVAATSLWAVASIEVTDLRDHRFMAPTDELASATLDGLPDGTYHLRFEGGESLVTVGPALALRLEDGGFDITVDPGPFGRGYGSTRTAGGQAVAGTIAVVNGTPDLSPDQRLLAQETFDGSDGSPLTISVVLEP